MLWQAVTSSLTLLILLTLCSAAWSQSISSPAFESQAALDAVKKFQELSGQLDQQVATHWETVKQQYVARMNQNKKDLIAALQSARDQAAKQVNLKEANALQEAIDRYESVEVSFPIPLPEIATDQAPQGQWSGKWNGSSERLSLDINQSGIISRRWKLQMNAGRLLAIDPQNEVHLELIVKPERLIVMGWTGLPADYFQTTDPEDWLTEPVDRAAILRQAGVVRVTAGKEINRFPSSSSTTNQHHYSVDGDGKRGVLDLVFNSRELNWTKRPKSATLFFHTNHSSDSGTTSPIFVYAGDKKIGSGSAKEPNQWHSISLDPALLQPARGYLFQLRVKTNDAVVIRGKAAGQTPYLELVFED